MWNVLQCRTFQLQAPIGTSDVTIAVKNLADIYGNDVEMTGSIQYATLEPESANNQEIISFTGITSVSTNVWNLTWVTRGLDAQPTNGVYGNDVANRRAHASSVDCILSDSPQVWDDKLSKSENETITGLYTFTTSPLVPTPTTASQAATKDYVDGVVASGAADAGTGTKGISRLSYSPTVTIGTATMTIASPCVVSFTAHGLTLNDSIQFTTTGALPTWLNVSTNYFVISTGLTADAFQISASLGWAAINTSGSQSGTHTLYKTTPVAIGNQDPSVTGGGTLGTPWSGNKFMTQAGVQAGSETYGADAGGDDTYVVALSPVLTAYTTGQELKFKPTTANTGACTIDFWPWVKNIKTIDGNDPQTGVIRANGVYTVVYDGTSFILQNEDFATTANKGISQLATNTIAETWSNTTDPVTPIQLDKYSISTSLRGDWYNFSIWMPSTSAAILPTGWLGSVAGASDDYGIAYYKAQPSGGAAAWILYAILPWTGSLQKYQYSGGKAIRVKLRLKIETPASDTDRTAFGICTTTTASVFQEARTGTSDGNIRFVLNNTWLYAVNSNWSNTNTLISWITTTNWNTYEIVYNVGTNILFYVNWVLQATHTTNLPTTATPTNVAFANYNWYAIEGCPLHISIEN